VSAFRYLSACAFAFLASPGVAAPQVLIGTATDKSVGALAGANVVVLSAQRTVVATTRTDQSGRFTVPHLPDGQYLVVIQSPGLADGQAIATIATANAHVNIVLDVTAAEQITVTASPGGLIDVNRLTQPVNIISAASPAIVFTASTRY
jgi:hypothetical protein